MGHLLALAIALAMDATAAAASLGARERSWRPVLEGAALFGLFQAAMSGLGCWGGERLVSWAEAWDHWVAFALLVAVGAKTLWEGLSHEPGQPENSSRARLWVLAFATSLDAAAAGLTLPLLEVAPALAVGVIGLVTWLLSLAGGGLGRRLGDQFGPKLDVLGGLVLMALGLKILLEHLTV